MEITELTLKLVLLLIPGAIASIVVEQLTIHKPWSAFRFIMSSIVLGCLSYLILQLIYLIPFLNIRDKGLQFWLTLTDASSIPFMEILYASIVAALLGLILTLGIQKKWLYKLSRRLKVSYKYGDECLYYYFLNSKNLSEVYVRDYEQNLTFHGFVQAFSESDLERELVLIDVDVYSLHESEYQYNSPAIFLSKQKNYNWQIEIPDFKSKNKQDGNNPKRKN